jgi:hypothetical protein
MYVIQKETPSSPLKIDAAAAAALSWEARGDAIASGIVERSSYDDPSIMCVSCRHLKRHHVPACRGKDCDCREYIQREEVVARESIHA